MDIHCVVTGQNESGKSVIVRHTPVKPVSLALLPGYEFHRLWGSDSVPELPSDGTPPSQPRYFPPKNGFRFGFFTIPPDTRTSVDPIGTSSALEEIQQKLPGMIDVLELDHPGMHASASATLREGKFRVARQPSAIYYVRRRAKIKTVSCYRQGET